MIESAEKLYNYILKTLEIIPEETICECDIDAKKQKDIISSMNDKNIEFYTRLHESLRGYDTIQLYDSPYVRIVGFYFTDFNNNESNDGNYDILFITDD